MGAGANAVSMTQKPVIVSLTSGNGATGVDPKIRELRVTFNVEIGEGCSWTGGGLNFPEIPQGMRPSWTPDRKTCILPVSLKTEWSYQLGINSPSH